MSNSLKHFPRTIHRHEEGRNEARYSNFYVSFICYTSLNNEMLF